MTKEKKFHEVGYLFTPYWICVTNRENFLIIEKTPISDAFCYVLMNLKSKERNTHVISEKTFNFYFININELDSIDD